MDWSILGLGVICFIYFFIRMSNQNNPYPEVADSPLLGNQNRQPQNQGWGQQNQGYAPQNQGYGQANQGYMPPQQNYPGII